MQNVLHRPFGVWNFEVALVVLENLCVPGSENSSQITAYSGV